jgi:predicted porin
MTRTLVALAAAVLAAGARAQTEAPTIPAPPPSDQATPPAATSAPLATPKKEEKKPKGTFVIGSKSEISINGRAWAEVNNVRATAGSAAAAKSVKPVNRVSSNSSYLRVRGERDLDGGWKAFAQLEAEFGLEGEAGTPYASTRNTGVGLSTPYGDLTLGKWDSPTKETTIGLDPFVGTGIFGYYNVFTAYRADRRLNNALLYQSPSVGGFTLLAAGSLGEATYAKKTTTVTVGTAPDTVKVSSTSTGTIAVNPYTASAALHYRNGGLYAGVSYEYRNDCANPDADAPAGPSCDRAVLGTDAQPNGVDQGVRVGASYVIKGTFTRLAGLYEHISLKANATATAQEKTLERDAYWGSITQGIFGERHQLILDYGLASSYSGKNIGTTAKTGGQTFTAAYRLNLDKDLMVYLAFAQIINEDNQTQKFGSGGVPGFSAPAGSTVTGFGGGVRYMF